MQTKTASKQLKYKMNKKTERCGYTSILLTFYELKPRFQITYSKKSIQVMQFLQLWLEKVAILTNQQLGRQVMQYASDLPSSCLPWRGVPPRPPYISANTVTPPEIEHKTITNTPKNCNVLRKHYLWTIYNICQEIFTYMRKSLSGSHSHILVPIFFQLTTEQGGHLKREQNHQVTISSSY